MSSDNLLTLKIPAGSYCAGPFLFSEERYYDGLIREQRYKCVLFNEALDATQGKIFKCEQCERVTWKLEAEQGNS